MTTDTAAVIGTAGAPLAVRLSKGSKTGALEVGIWTDDQATVEGVREIMKTRWDDPLCSRVDMEQVSEESRRRVRGGTDVILKSKTLLAACREAPQLFASVFVVPHDTPLGAGAKSKLDDLHGDPVVASLSNQSDARFPGFQFTLDIAGGIYLIAIDFSRKVPRVGDPCLVIDSFRKVPVSGERDLTVAVSTAVRIPTIPVPLKLSRKEKAELKRGVEKILAIGDDELIAFSTVVDALSR